MEGIAAQLTATKGPRGAARLLVDQPRGQFLAGTAFAGDQHGFVGAGEAAEHRGDLTHRRTVADELGTTGAAGRRAAAGGALFTKARVQPGEQAGILDGAVDEQPRQLLDGKPGEITDADPDRIGYGFLKHSSSSFH